MYNKTLHYTNQLLHYTNQESRTKKNNILLN